MELLPAARTLRQAVARGMAAKDRPSAQRPSSCFIERYSFFQGYLHITGALQASANIEAIALSLPSGSVCPLRFTRRGPNQVAFDQVTPIPGDSLELAKASLLATLADGSVLRINDLGAANDDPAHALSAQFRSMLAERPPGLLLEVGSRARSSFVGRSVAPPGWGYSGFDIMNGPNVDVVGDAHQLSNHYSVGQFDAIMAYSVLEHLLMPWKFVVELNRVLKPGAIGLFTTHQCWPLHDQPWDFWRFSDMAWTALLNPATGFEIISAKMGEPAFIVAQKCSAETAFAEAPAAALASFVLFRKIAETSLQWPVELGAITATNYPPTSTR